MPRSPAGYLKKCDVIWWRLFALVFLLFGPWRESGLVASRSYGLLAFLHQVCLEENCCKCRTLEILKQIRLHLEICNFYFYSFVNRCSGRICISRLKELRFLPSFVKLITRRNFVGSECVVPHFFLCLLLLR